jgi:hypothetical protein
MCPYPGRKSPAPGGFHAASAPEGRGRFEKKVCKMKRSLDMGCRFEFKIVQAPQNPRPLKAGLNGSVFSRNGSPARGVIWVGGAKALAKRYTAKLLFLLCLNLLLSSCLSKKDYTEDEIQALMDGELQRKIAAYRKSKIDACQEEAFRQATKIADSLVIAEAYFDRDTFARPPKPIKPDEKAPEIKGPDTIQLKPLFEGKRKKVKVDTLLKKAKRDTTSRKKN